MKLLAVALGAWLALAAPALGQVESPVAHAQALATAGAYDDAHRLLTTWLAAHPDDLEARFLLARVLSWQGRNEEALAEADRLLAASGQDADYGLLKARILAALGRDDEAVEVLERTRGLAPQYQEVWQVEIDVLERGDADSRRRAAHLRAEARARFGQLPWLAKGPPVAQRPPWELEAGAGYEYLTNGYQPWAEGGVRLQRTFAPRQAGVLTARDAYRFGVHDLEVGAGWYQPVGDRLTVDVEGNASPGHQVLPAWSLAGAGYYGLGRGWDVALDVRETAYTAVSVTREMLVLDKQLGPWRASYALYISQLPGAPYALSHVGSLDYDFASGSRETLTASTGTEMDFIGPGNITASNVLAASLWGRTWLGTNWGLTHALEVVSQGTSYTRGGVRVGILVAF